MCKGVFGKNMQTRVKESMLGVLSQYQPVAGVSPQAGEQDRLPGKCERPPGYDSGRGEGLCRGRGRHLAILLCHQAPQ